MKKPAYQCIRCGYQTWLLGDVKKHLLMKKKVCPALLNNIELTKDIIDFIIDNRIYVIPKEPKEPKKKVVKKDTSLENINKGAIYIFYSRACKNGDEAVYKIGKSGNYLLRKNQYDKGGDMVFVVNVKNRHEAENMIKQAFKIEFIQRRDYGIEYFEGDIMEMVILMQETLKEEIEEIVINFSCKAVTL